MGKHLNKLLGKGFRVSKFKPLVTLALSRLSVLKLQRQVRCTQARTDVVQLLQFGHHERALLRVEQVIKERNMMDAYTMIQGYCNLLGERADLIEEERECPEELKEAISTMIYAASRCGDFPELQEIRSVFASHFGKDFVARAVELRNNCGVNVTMIMKLSTRQPSLESRMKVLQEIAAEHSIALNFDGDSSSSIQENKPAVTKVPDLQDDSYCPPEICQVSDSVEMRKYKDVADAAEAAFQSAAQAAAAARAAVQLSRSAPQDPDNHTGADTQEMNPVEEMAALKESDLGKQDASMENLTEGGNAEEVKRSASSSGPDITDVQVTEHLGQEEEIILEKSNMDKENEHGEEIVSEKSHLEKDNGQSDETEQQNKDSGEKDSTPSVEQKTESTSWFPFQKQIRLKLQAGHKKEKEEKFSLKGKPFSARTRAVRGY